MQANAVSYRTKQQNLLKSKTQAFLNNYSQSLQRVQSRSSMHALAGSVYSSARNRQMTPNRTASNSVLFPLIAFENPEIAHSQAVKGLNMRASHISNYSDVNTELLHHRKALEERIALLRDETTREKKLHDRADIAAKKAANDIERANNSIRDLSLRSDRLNEAITEARQDCNELRNALNTLRSDNTTTTTAVAAEQASCDQWENRGRLLKNGLLTEEKAKTALKAELIRAQKVMTSCSILTKEREHERAVLLLAINTSVALNLL